MLKKLILLLTLVTLAIGQTGHDNWLHWNNWLSRSRGLIPTKSLALFVSPGTQMIEHAKANKKYPALRLDDNLVGNGDFHDFTFDIDSGLVAHWIFDDYYHMNEGTGKTILQDLSGNSHDLTVSSGFDYSNQLTGSDPAYRSGNALEFDGVDDYLYIPAAQATAFNPNGDDFSVAAWVKYTNIVEYAGIFGKGYDLWRLDMQIYGTPRFTVSNAPFWMGTTPINDGQWHLLVGTYSASDSTIRAYVDGQLVKTGTNVAPPTSNSRDLMLGLNDNNDKYYNGFEASVAYFNRALSAQEVQELYGKAKGWEWDGNGSIENDNFKQVISGGGQLTQDVTINDTVAYKEHLVSTTKDSVNYFGQTSSHTITLGDGTWTQAAVQELLNVDMTGSTAIDYSGNDLNGTMQGGLETGQPVNPYAWQTDGVDDYIDFGDTLNMGTYDFILCDWIILDPNNKNTFCRKGGGYSTSWPGYTLFYDNGGVYFQIGSSSNVFYNGRLSSSDHLIDDNKWHFIVVVVKRSSVIELYIDDVLNNSVDISAYAGESIDNTRDFYYLSVSPTYYLSQRLSGLGLIYKFDGQNGRLSKLLSNYKTYYIDKIYRNTKRYFQ